MNLEEMMQCSKKLSEMNLEELWHLFPIELVPHDSRWIKWAEEEINILRQVLKESSPTITHIGSTSIPHIHAKPIIDILVEIPMSEDFESIRQRLDRNGYICMSVSSDRISFNKGYTSSGYAERVFHIHVHREGDNNEILFRDYLLSYPEAAMEYEHLKQSLLPEYRNNRDKYTEQKTGFVTKIVDKARHKK